MGTSHGTGQLVGREPGGNPAKSCGWNRKSVTNQATYRISLNQQGTHLTPCPSSCHHLYKQDLTYDWGVFKAERKCGGGYNVDSKLPLPGSALCWSLPEEISMPRAAVPRCAWSTGLMAGVQEGQVSKRQCCAAVKALCPPEISIHEADSETSQLFGQLLPLQWCTHCPASGAGPRFWNVKNIGLLFLLPLNIMGKDVITANPCGVSGISWPVRVDAAFMYSMNWAQVLLPTAGDFFKGIPIRWKCGRWQKPQCQTTVLRMFWMALYFNSWFPLAFRQPAIYLKS